MSSQYYHSDRKAEFGKSRQIPLKKSYINEPNKGRSAREMEPNAETYAAMESAENNEDLCGPFDTVEELMAALDED